ncbi:MAG: GT4 family glycosyltransferase PelF [Oscillospiraceae bacterium]|nr:GT4 family glycosyltransferase PelF [Oscillospiraceae bacterium]
MKVCIVAEGCYPYTVGGVSSWVDSMIKLFPNVEFVLMTIVSDREQRGKFVYELPENLTAVYEVYLQDLDWDYSKKKGQRARLHREEYLALRSIILNRDVNWEPLFKLFNNNKISTDEILMGRDFLRLATECYNLKFPQIPFSDFLWTLRSIYLPLFLVMRAELPEADLYHCVATGYAGVLGSMAKYFHGCGLLISEHGIYTREREEELIKATWVKEMYKNIWIEQFRKMSNLAYEEADIVTSLYERARVLQTEIGCPEEKTIVTPNGIDVERFSNLPGKTAEDKGVVNIGAMLRVTPIKDVKSMIQAFYYAKQQAPNIKLWIMGSWDEESEYAEECFQLVEDLKVADVVFTGQVNVADYLGRMDMTILTSISEGQPLSVLESYAAHKPVIATDVGCCRELIYGDDMDDFGPAGILTHIMNLDEMADAIVELAKNTKLRLEMGENGYRRVKANFQKEQMKNTYQKIYMDFAEKLNVPWETPDEGR